VLILECVNACGVCRGTPANGAGGRIHGERDVRPREAATQAKKWLVNWFALRANVGSSRGLIPSGRFGERAYSRLGIRFKRRSWEAATDGSTSEQQSRTRTFLPSIVANPSPSNRGSAGRALVLPYFSAHLGNLSVLSTLAMPALMLTSLD